MFKGLIKNTNEQPDEEIPRARSEKVPRSGVSVPTEWGLCHPPGVDVFTHLEALETPMLLGFYEASSCRHDQLFCFLTLSSLEDEK